MPQQRFSRHLPGGVFVTRHAPLVEAAYGDEAMAMIDGAYLSRRRRAEREVSRVAASRLPMMALLPMPPITQMMPGPGIYHA